MRTTAKLVFSSVASVSALTYGGAALAQTATQAPPTVNDTTQGRTAIPGATVTQADQDLDDATMSLEPIGARVGSFILYPKVETGITYNDNVYAIEDKVDDFVAKISPSLDFRGDLGVATAALRASLDRYEYFERETESRTDWSLGANASVEASRGTFVYAAGGFSRAHEDRGDPNAVYTAREPTRYDLSEVGGGLSTSVTRLRLGVDGSYRNFNYRDNVQQNGFAINNDDRDREQVRLAGRAGFEFSPGYSFLARLAYETVNYRLPVDDSDFNRDSEGWRATAGVNFELSRLLEGEVWGGYLTRSYDDARFGKVERAVFGTALTWYPTPLTKVRVNVDRNVLETVFPGYRGFLSTTAALGVEHELLRTVKLTLDARYGRDEYLRARLATVDERHDDNYSFSAGVKYTLNRNIYTRLTYDWSKRSSDFDFPGIEFNRNRVTAGVGLQF
jgi:hypothetical protein